MKKTLLTLMGLVTSVGVMAQGLILFNGSVADTTDTPGGGSCIVTENGAKIGNAWNAQLYWGTSADSLAPAIAADTGAAIIAAFRTRASDGANLGYFTGGSQAVQGAAAGTDYFFQVRAFEKAKGADYTSAVANGSKFGMSDAITLKLTAAPAPPQYMKGLTGFAVIPEPSIMALGALGALALMLRRRS